MGKVSLSPTSILRSLRSNKLGNKQNLTMVYLNVYDLTPMNDYLYWLGHGVFHSGIEVYGSEYGFGAHDYPTSGVFEVEPRCCPGFTFRRSIPLGQTDMSPAELLLFMENLSEKYHGDTYHLLYKNCNHFTNDVCRRLIGKRIPGWVNRLARLGSYWSCLLPKGVTTASVGLPDSQTCSEYGCCSCGSGESEMDDQFYQLLVNPNTNIEMILKDISLKQ